MNSASIRSRRIFIFVFLSFVLIFFPRQSSAQSKSFYWERFDVNITVLENGDLRIIETQTLDFSGGTFTFGFRGIPVGTEGANDGIFDISVSEGGVTYTESGSNNPQTFEVNREAGEEVIRWYFQPTVGQHTYTIAYTVKGGVRVGSMEEGSGDQVFWKPTPTDLAARINRSAVTINLPEGIQPQQFTGTSDFLVAAYIDGDEGGGVQTSVSEDGRSITYATTQPLFPGQVFEVRVQFPHGLLSIPTPDWQSREQRGDVISLIVLAAAIFIAISGPLLVVVMWYAVGRDPDAGIVVPEFVSEPPDRLPPGVVGTLVDEKADMRDIISTLVDLARRGYLNIGEDGRNHIFTRTEKPDGGLRPYERTFLNDIFGGKRERSLKSLRYKFAERLPNLRRMLYEELKNEDLVPQSPESIRNRYGCLSFALIAGAVGSFVAIPALFGDTVSTAVCPAFSVGLTAVTLLVASRFMPVKTRKGSEAAAKWEAFKTYLQNAERYGNLEEATDVFEKYLAYATAFGLERTWIRKFSQIPATPVPTWYGPYLGPAHHGSRRMVPRSSKGGGSSGQPSLEGMAGKMGGGLAAMSAGLGRMLSSTATVLKSTPPSSSGSSGGFSGGFSGGSSGGGGSAGFG